MESLSVRGSVGTGWIERFGASKRQRLVEEGAYFSSNHG